MRIAYGVMGYGRGHATRAAAVLPALAAEHEVTVFAGGDAYRWLSPRFPCVRIPTLGYAYGDRGRHSISRTVARNLSPLTDLLVRGPACLAVEREFQRRGVELVISDSEAFCHQAARRLRRPRISFDHVGIIAWCRPHFPPELWWQGRRDAAVYRALMGEPEAVLISSFYRAAPRRRDVEMVGPLLRPAVHRYRPRRGEHLLVYLNQGAHQFRALRRTLRLLDLPVRIYGTPLRGAVENLEFRPPSESGFLDDLAGCRAVICTAGNQLVGEALHYAKPILALPEDAFEQRLNACLIERLGVGARAELTGLTPSDVDRWLAAETRFAANAAALAGDGRAAAIEILLRWCRTLAGRRARNTPVHPARKRSSSAPSQRLFCANRCGHDRISSADCT